MFGFGETQREGEAFKYALIGHGLLAYSFDLLVFYPQLREGTRSGSCV